MMGKFLRGIICPDLRFKKSQEPMEILRHKTLLHTNVWDLYLETAHLMCGDWQRSHALFQALHMFIPDDLYPWLMVNMINCI